MNVTTGLDIAKNVFQVIGVDGHGKVVLRKNVSRGKDVGMVRQSSAVPHRH